MIEPLTILLWSLAVGATSSGIVTAFRALPPIAWRVEALEKPWACDVCMSFWATGLIGLCLAAWFGVEYLVVCGPAYPWAMWTLRRVTDPVNFPIPMLPEKEDD